jgi:prepilin-type N-terminal cleavage/methylation domain-containing protein
MPVMRMRPQNQRSGFTMVELLIVVMIITLLLAIAVPNFLRACEISHAHSCIANLKEIEEAKGQWAMDHPTTVPDVEPAATELYGRCGYLRSTPRCPSGGTYTIGDLSTVPTCSFGAARTPAHAIP